MFLPTKVSPDEMVLGLFSQLAKKKQKKAEYHARQKGKKRNKRFTKGAKKAASPQTKDKADPETSGAPAKGPGPQKEETLKCRKKEMNMGKKAQVKVPDSEDEIPTLVPIGAAPVKENVEVLLLILGIHRGLSGWPLRVRQALLSDECERVLRAGGFVYRNLFQVKPVLPKILNR